MEGYINICKSDGALTVMGGIYNNEDKAKESGKCIRGYFATISIIIPDDNKEVNE